MEEPTSTRRSVLGGLGTATLGLGGFRFDSSSGTEAERADGFVLRQGDRCLPLTPLSGDVSAREFYDYRVPNPAENSYAVRPGSSYSSEGTVELQRPNTSILFLYDGPDGVSLCLVHGKYTDQAADGGSATFEFANLPADGEWVVQDDEYEGGTNFDNWETDETEARVDWTWAGGRTDGGVFRGLTTDDDVAVRPRFNERATLFRQHYEGRVESWQALSGDQSSPDRYELALDVPVSIAGGICPSTRGPVELPIDVAPDVLEGANKKITLFVRSTDEVDVRDILTVSVRFGPGGAVPMSSKVALVAGTPTLKLRFAVADLELTGDDPSATFRARTRDGTDVFGTVTFRTPSESSDERREREREKREEKRETETEERGSADEDEAGDEGED